MLKRISDRLRLVECQLRLANGQGMAEYALILGLVAAVAILSLTTLGTDVKTAFDSITAAF